MNDPRLQALLDKYRDGALTEEDRAELERTLLSSPQARREFWEQARFHSMLSRWGQEQWGRRMADGGGMEPAEATSPLTEVPGRAVPWMGRIRPIWAAWATAAAACIALGLVLYFGRAPGRPPVVQSDGTLGNSAAPATAPTGIAILASAVDATWADPAAARLPGTVLDAGTLKLRAGAVQIEFYSGARLIVQGPVELELKSDMEAHCRLGRVTAHVPAPAHGFKFTTPAMQVVDLGTDFGVYVPPTGAPEVHVFAGAVEVSRGGRESTPIKLSAGQAARSEGQELRTFLAKQQEFLREPAFAQLASGEMQRRRDAWTSAAAALDRDPAALAHFTFGQPSDGGRAVPNRALLAPSAASSASVVGCGWADGRWPGQRALELRSVGDRLRVEVPGQFQAVTLIAWVRIDAWPEGSFSLLTPDVKTPGTLRWSLNSLGEMRLAIARASGHAEPNWEVIIGTVAVAPERLGRWIMLASTFDGKVLRHFVDGEMIKSGFGHSPAPLTIGPAEIGNWRGPTRRYFQGRMDELAILSRAMTPEEIKELFSVGQPVHSVSP